VYKSIHEKKWVIINNKKENGLMMRNLGVQTYRASDKQQKLVTVLHQTHTVTTGIVCIFKSSSVYPGSLSTMRRSTVLKNP